MPHKKSNSTVSPNRKHRLRKCTYSLDQQAGKLKNKSPKKKKKENLKPNNELFLFIHIEIIQLFQLFIENSNEPILKVSQRTSTSLAAPTNGFQGRCIGGIVKRNGVLKGRKKKIKRMVGGYWVNGGRKIRVVFEELFEGFVTEKFVSPLGERLFQMGLEFLPKFHSRKLKRLELTIGAGEMRKGELN